MKKAGIALLVIQVVVLLSGFATENSIFSQISGGADLFKVIGYFTPGIIGLILYLKAQKKEEAEKTGKPRGGEVFCPKCGAAAEAGDAFCANCGSPIKRK